ncbi:hypothetical protein A4X09_0g377 [Tilletia walkeri]|uniref:Uncharacterized protein n=1 Tax=Tilletia walkeri TaxID=117179 RepID=A0A8X7T7M5_9BASI|nr:hypothetical protein A4X09_0g377 [Tilletia walkeri]
MELDAFFGQAPGNSIGSWVEVLRGPGPGQSHRHPSHDPPTHQAAHVHRLLTDNARGCIDRNRSSPVLQRKRLLHPARHRQPEQHLRRHPVYSAMVQILAGDFIYNKTMLMAPLRRSLSAFVFFTLGAIVMSVLGERA